MRAAMVPTALAVTSAGSHYVVTAVNTSDSYLHFQQQLQASRSPSSPTATPNNNNNGTSATVASHTLVRFQIHHLLPRDWTALLRMCSALSHPTGSFTFTSPGGISPPLTTTEEETASDDQPHTGAVTPLNNCFFHIVERTLDDFVPNNLIYYKLQSYQASPPPSPAASPTAAATTQAGGGGLRERLRRAFAPRHPTGPATAPGGTAAGLIATRFSAFLRALQAQPPQPLETLRTAGVTPSDSYANVAAKEKAARDPLNHVYRALRYSAMNQQICCDGSSSSSCPAAAAAEVPARAVPPTPAEEAQEPIALEANTFMFFPHKISVQEQIPFRTRHFCFIVNLMPIVPLHLLLVPLRCVGTIHALEEGELQDWGAAAHLAVRVLDLAQGLLRDAHYLECVAQGDEAAAAAAIRAADEAATGPGCSSHSYSIAVQQGRMSGQTVSHLHVHVIPFDPTGRLAGEPEQDGVRRPHRSGAEMAAETARLRPIFAYVAAKHAAAAAGAAGTEVAAASL